MQYTDVSTGTVVTKPVTWTGPCATPTNLPLLVNQVQASYSGSLVPYYAPSSASESVTVWPFDE